MRVGKGIGKGREMGEGEERVGNGGEDRWVGEWKEKVEGNKGEEGKGGGEGEDGVGWMNRVRWKETLRIGEGDGKGGAIWQYEK